ncbi:transposase [Marispirochaeta sp.]|jgi:putative transposase|uniref:transposase n=1 Tax=Marispirochaeta sp. TaxID=2038653 RepID=UPI0029C77511|nr:transposase [Marispirochaeta sp.]
MSGKIIEINEEEVKAHLGEFVRKTVEETLNAMLEAEAEQLLNAQKHERNTDRKGYRAGHYDRKLLTKADEVNLKMPMLKKVTFETAQLY